MPTIDAADDRTKAGQHVEIEHWFASLRRRRILFLAVVLGCLAFGALLTVVQAPVYEATAEVALSPSAGASLLGTAEATPDLASELKTASNSTVAGIARDRLGNHAGAVTITADDASTTLIFAGTGSSAQAAADVANAYAESYVEVRQQRTQTEYETALKRLSAKVDDVDERIAALAPPPADADIRANLQAQRAAYRAAIDQLEVASTVGGTSSARVITPAEPPARRSSPLLGKYLAYSLVAGLVLGAGAVGVAEFLDRSVRGVEGAREAAGAAPVLGRVRVRSPRVTARRKRSLIGARTAAGPAEGMPLASDNLEGTSAGTGVVTLDAPTSADAEDFRALRTTTLSMLDAARPFIQIASASADDGATLVAANLAAAIALSGQPTVLVSLVGLDELDLRLEEIEQRDPLTALLTGTALTTECMAPVVGIEHLTAIVGPSDSTHDDHAHRSINDALKQLQSLSRTVVLLSPPVLTSAHALEVSQLVDGTVLVVSEGSTRAADLTEATRALGLMDALLLGVVLA